MNYWNVSRNIIIVYQFIFHRVKKTIISRKKIIMIAVVVIAAIIIVSMFPYKRVLAPEPAVTVKSASSILQVVGTLIIPQYV